MRRLLVRRGLMALLLLAIAVPLCAFLYAVVKEAFGGTSAGETSPVRDLLEDPAIRSAARNTVVIVVAVSIASTVLGSMLAFAVIKAQIKPARLFRIMQYVPITIPSFVGAIGWVFLASPRTGWLNVGIRQVIGGERGPLNIFTVWGVIWVSTLYVTPFVLAIMASALERCGSDPFEAYVSNGTPGWLAAIKVVTGVLRPALVGAFLLAVAEATIQFSVPLLLSYDVLTTRLYQFALWSSPPRPDVSSLLAIVLVIFGGGLTLLEWLLIGRKRYAALSGRGMQTSAWRIGRGSRSILKGVAIVYVLAAVVLPICGIVVVSLMPYWTPSVTTLTLDNYRGLFSSTGFGQGLANSVRLAIGTTVAVLVVATTICLLRAHRVNRRLANAIYTLASLPIAVPGLVFGLGALVVYLNVPVPLYGTAVGIGIVYVIHFLPLALRNIGPVVAQVGPELQESARTSGARPTRVLADITLPMIAPGLASCATLVFVFAVREFPISSLLSTPTFKLASVYIVDNFQNGVYPQVASMALIFCVIGVVAVVLMQLASSRVRFGQKTAGSETSPASTTPAKATIPSTGG